MPKPTLNQLENKVSKLIEFNDYERLELFLQEYPTFSINNINSRGFLSLLNEAASFKSRECFDFIISHPNYNLYQFVQKMNDDDRNYILTPPLYFTDENADNKMDENADNKMDENTDDENDGNLSLSDNKFNYYEYDYNIMNAIDISVAIYKNAPNQANAFYLKKLIVKGVYFDPEILNKLEDHPEFYYQILSKYQDNLLYMKKLLFDKIKIKSTKFESLFLTLKPNLNNEDLNKILNIAICHNLSYIINILKNSQFDIKYMNGWGINNFLKIDTISYCLSQIKNYNKKKVVELELFKIILNEFINSESIYLPNKSYFLTSLFSAEKFLIESTFNDLKKINFNIDFASDLMNNLINIIDKKYFFHHLKSINLEIIFKLGLCKTNLWNYLTDSKLNFIVELSREDAYWSADIKKFIKDLLIISLNNNFIPKKEHLKILSKIANIKLNEKNLIDQEIILNHYDNNFLTFKINVEQIKKKKFNKSKNNEIIV